MARGSMKMRPNKRSNSSTKPPNPSMSTHAPPSQFRCRKIFVIAPTLLAASLIFLLSISSNGSSLVNSDAHTDQLYTVEVVNEYPHDPQAFTQGLVYDRNDTFFESTGLRGRSSVRKVALRTGKVEAIHQMPNSYFGEGLTLLDERLYQVTWLQKIGFIYDRRLNKIDKFTHEMKDGWGLATDGKVLFGSDGTSILYQLDPRSLEVTARHTVMYKGNEVHNINELEYVKGEVWANVWLTDCIARISHKDGSVAGWILLQNLRQGLIAAGVQGIDVLNGIAWDSDNDRLFVTGKLWPKLYEIKLHPLKTPFGGDIKQICMPKLAYFGKPGS